MTYLFCKDSALLVIKSDSKVWKDGRSRYRFLFEIRHQLRWSKWRHTSEDDSGLKVVSYGDADRLEKVLRGYK